jgi:hypothetical protein
MRQIALIAGHADHSVARQWNKPTAIGRGATWIDRRQRVGDLSHVKVCLGTFAYAGIVAQKPSKSRVAHPSLERHCSAFAGHIQTITPTTEVKFIAKIFIASSINRNFSKLPGYDGVLSLPSESDRPTHLRKTVPVELTIILFR